ncbi:hypothetical protein Tco_0580670 [Tanacetum coccineum]
MAGAQQGGRGVDMDGSSGGLAGSSSMLGRGELSVRRDVWLEKGRGSSVLGKVTGYAGTSVPLEPLGPKSLALHLAVLARVITTRPACRSSLAHVSNDSESLYHLCLTSTCIAVSRVPGDGSCVHTHDHDGSEAPDESPDSILSSEPKPLGKHRPPPPPSILFPGELSYPS